MMITLDRAIELRGLIEKASASLDDGTALTALELFPMWEVDHAYQTGDRVQYEGKLYKCLQAHSSQSDWTPDTAVSLWVEVADPSVEFPEWKQPQGAHDAYQTGDKVSHNEKRWISEADNNIWEPGVFGWREV
jgi:hypothetical protein